MTANRDKVLVTRPLEDAIELAATLAAQGLLPVVEPILKIVPLEGAPLDLTGVQAILVTSANGVRALARRLGPTAGRDVRLLAVGDMTKAAAAGEGFTAVGSAAGDVAALAELAKAELDPKAGKLLHVAGSDVAGDLAGSLRAAGFAVERIVLYRAEPATELAATTVAAFRAGEIGAAMFFSGRTARNFVALAKEAGLEREFHDVAALCLSEPVAEQARALVWREVRIAGRPDRASMLALADQLRPKATATLPPPSQPQITRSDFRPAWVGAAVLTVALGLWVYSLFSRAPSPAGDPALMNSLAETTSRLAAYDRRIGELEAARATEAAKLASRLDALERTAKAPPAEALDRRLTAIETGLARAEESARSAGDARLAAVTGALDRRIAALESNGRGGEAAFAFALGVARLKDATRGASPFIDALELARRAGQGDAAAEKLLAELAPLAPQGALPIPALRERFDPMLREVLQAAAKPDEPGWMDQTIAKLKGLVLVRRIGEGAPKESVEGRLAEAESRLRRGDIAGAADALDGLALKVPAAEGWIERARERAAVDRVIAALEARALERLVPAGSR
jgi:uroporphyrinogen-III synthase